MCWNGIFQTKTFSFEGIIYYLLLVFLAHGHKRKEGGGFWVCFHKVKRSSSDMTKFPPHATDQPLKERLAEISVYSNDPTHHLQAVVGFPNRSCFLPNRLFLFVAFRRGGFTNYLNMNMNSHPEKKILKKEPAMLAKLFGRFFSLLFFVRNWLILNLHGCHRML